MNLLIFFVKTLRFKGAGERIKVGGLKTTMEFWQERIFWAQHSGFSSNAWSKSSKLKPRGGHGWNAEVTVKAFWLDGSTIWSISRPLAKDFCRYESKTEQIQTASKINTQEPYKSQLLLSLSVKKRTSFADWAYRTVHFRTSSVKNSTNFSCSSDWPFKTIQIQTTSVT
jgi:hypothetical protein